MKKTLSLILVLLMVLSLFAACGTTENPENNPGSTGPFTKYDPKITVTYAMPFYPDWVTSLDKLGQTMESNVWTDGAKDELGIKLVLTEGTTDVGAYYERLTANIASGSFPDFANVGTAQMSCDYFSALEKSDMLADLTEIFNKVGSEDFLSTINGAGESIFLPCTFEGKRKGLPMVDAAGGSSFAFWYIRKDWLDNLNMSIPTNLDELYNVAKAFTENDPDGNGQDDTTGFTCDNFFKTTLNGIFNGFGAYPGIWIENDSGDLVYGSTQPEMKDALEYIKNLYVNGYMLTFDEMSSASFDNSIIRGEAGIFNGVIHSGSLAGNAKKINPDAEFVAVPIFDENGDIAKVTSSLNSYFYYAVSAESRYPEAIVKLCNLYIRAALDDGELYENYIAGADGSDRSSFAPVRMLNIISENNPQNTLGEDLTEAVANRDNSNIKIPYYRDTVYRLIVDYLDNGTSDGYGQYLIFGENGTAWQINEFREDDLFMMNQFVASPTPAMSSYQATLDEYEYGCLTEIIMATQPIDYFDAFVSNWNSTGGNEITNEVNAWYSSVK